MSPLEKTHKFRLKDDSRRFFDALEKSGFVPVCRAARIEAFHGTSVSRARNILKQNEIYPTALRDFYSSEDDFLGEGQYLWEDSEHTGGKSGKEAALLWARKRYANERPAVVSATLEFKRLFDLMGEKNTLFAREFRRQIKAQADLEAGAREALNHWRDWRFVKLLVLSCPKLAELDIDGVRWNGFGLPKAAYLTQTGVCVKDPSCIKDLRIVP